MYRYPTAPQSAYQMYGQFATAQPQIPGWAEEQWRLQQNGPIPASGHFSYGTEGQLGAEVNQAITEASRVVKPIPIVAPVVRGHARLDFQEYRLPPAYLQAHRMLQTPTRPAPLQAVGTPSSVQTVACCLFSTVPSTPPSTPGSTSTPRKGKWTPPTSRRRVVSGNMLSHLQKEAHTAGETVGVPPTPPPKVLKYTVMAMIWPQVQKSCYLSYHAYATLLLTEVATCTPVYCTLPPAGSRVMKGRGSFKFNAGETRKRPMDIVPQTPPTPSRSWGSTDYIEPVVTPTRSRNSLWNTPTTATTPTSSWSTPSNNNKRTPTSKIPRDITPQTSLFEDVMIKTKKQLPVTRMMSVSKPHYYRTHTVAFPKMTLSQLHFFHAKATAMDIMNISCHHYFRVGAVVYPMASLSLLHLYRASATISEVISSISHTHYWKAGATVLSQMSASGYMAPSTPSTPGSKTRKGRGHFKFDTPERVVKGRGQVLFQDPLRDIVPTAPATPTREWASMDYVGVESETPVTPSSTERWSKHPSVYEQPHTNRVRRTPPHKTPFNTPKTVTPRTITPNSGKKTNRHSAHKRLDRQFVEVQRAIEEVPVCKHAHAIIHTVTAHCSCLHVYRAIAMVLPTASVSKELRFTVSAVVFPVAIASGHMKLAGYNPHAAPFTPARNAGVTDDYGLVHFTPMECPTVPYNTPGQTEMELELQQCLTYEEDVICMETCEPTPAEEFAARVHARANAGKPPSPGTQTEQTMRKKFMELVRLRAEDKIPANASTPSAALLSPMMSPKSPMRSPMRSPLASPLRSPLASPLASPRTRRRRALAGLTG